MNLFTRTIVAATLFTTALMSVPPQASASASDDFNHVAVSTIERLKLHAPQQCAEHSASTAMPFHFFKTLTVRAMQAFERGDTDTAFDVVVASMRLSRDGARCGDLWQVLFNGALSERMIQALDAMLRADGAFSRAQLKALADEIDAVRDTLPNERALSMAAADSKVRVVQRANKLRSALDQTEAHIDHKVSRM